MALWKEHFKSLPPKMKLAVPSNLQFPELELKEFQKELKYIYLREGRTFSVIVSSSLNELQEGKLKRLLTQHKGAIGWTIADLNGINLSICTHRIFLEDNTKPVRQMQRRLNPTI